MTKREFRLQPVLHYKENLVELRKLELAAAQRKLHAGRTILEELKAEERQVARLIREQHEAGELDLAVLGVGRAYLEDLQHRVGGQELTVKELEVAVLERMEALVSAKQEQETLERLKERARAQFNREMLQLEARLVDESATAGFNRRPIDNEE